MDVSAFTKEIVGNIEQVIVGKRPQLILAIASWLCEGHILLEDVPGVAKTMLARAMARSVGCSFKRIQKGTSLGFSNRPALGPRSPR